MKRLEVALFAAASCCLIAAGGCGKGEERVTPELLARGRELFTIYCSGCHPGGENRIYRQKTLHRMDLRANGITDAAGIVRVIRAPGAGMKRFGKETISDADASAIAHYILATF